MRSPTGFLALVFATAAWAQVQPEVPVPAGDPYSGPIFERLQRARQEAGMRPFERRPALERAARQRARQVAALAHRDRLTVAEPIGDLVRRAGQERFRNLTMHLDLQRGYPDPAAAFFSNWRKHTSWPRVVGAGFEAAGLAVERGADGWLVFVAVLLEDMKLPEDLGAIERETSAGIDAARARAGLQGLVREPWLDAVARAHSADMAARGYFDHRSPDGHGVAERVGRTGRPYRALAENIHRSQGAKDAAADAVRSWMDSAGHRDNVLDGRFELTGLGVALDGEGRLYFTQLFVAP